MFRLFLTIKKKPNSNIAESCPLNKYNFSLIYTHKYKGMKKKERKREGILKEVKNNLNKKG